MTVKGATSKREAMDQAVANMNMPKLVELIKDPKQPAALKAAARRKLKRQSEADKTPGPRMAKGGDAKKVPVITIGVGMAEFKKGKDKAKMAKGGMANGKQHMYLNDGGLVMDNLNPGLKALAKKRPDVVKKILKKS